MKTVKNGTFLTTIQLKETTGDQILSKKSEKVKKRKLKSPSRMARDRNRLEAFLSRKAGSCNRNSAAAASTPPTTQCATPAATRRTVSAGRKLGSGIGGAGFEKEGAGIHCPGWRPGVGLGNSPIEQLDGGGKVFRFEEDGSSSDDDAGQCELCQHVFKAGPNCHSCDTPKRFCYTLCSKCTFKLCHECLRCHHLKT